MSIQSTLSEGDGVAEELAEGQRAIAISEFFEQNKQMLGFDSDSKAIVTAVKEAVDNALDAAEEASYLPEIKVEIQESGEYYKLIVEDNGPGITQEQIPKVFGKLLYGSRFHLRAQSRGQQGIGISAAVMYAQNTSGKPARITSKVNGADKAQFFEIRIDTDENEPEINTSETVDWDEKDHGTRIELELAGNMRARKQLHSYIRRTALVNPHAIVHFDEPGLSEPMKFDRATNELPEEPEEIKPHPHGVELGTLKTMLQSTKSYALSGFLQEEFTRVGKKTADNIIDNFRDRYFGSEMTWQVPDSSEDDIKQAIIEVVNKKGKERTEQYASYVFSNLQDYERVSYGRVQDAVSDAASEASEEFEKFFGETVREKTVEVVWETLPVDSSLYSIVDEATSKRKDDEAVEFVGEELTRKIREINYKNRVTPSELRGFISDAAENSTGETFGDKSREKIYNAVWDLFVTVSDEVPSVNEVEGERQAIQSLLVGMDEADVISPPSTCLSPIEEDLIKEGLKQSYDADFYAAATRDAEVYEGEPFIVEAGIAYGGELQSEGQAEILRFANRVPLVYQRGACSTTDVVKNIDWRNYKLSQSGGYGIPEGPVVILIHVASTNVPFTSESKDALANVEIIEYEVERALRLAARKLKSHLNKQKSLKKRRERQEVVASMLPVIADKAATVIDEEPADIEDSLARIMSSVVVEDGDERVYMENYSDTEQFTLHIELEEKPKYPSQNVEREETEDGWRLVWDGSLGEGEDTEITWNTDEDSKPELEFKDMPVEKVTRKRGDSE